MLTLVSFLVALAILIAVHEYGHYRVAVACGVRVQRFAIGFGPVIWRWRPARQRPDQDTEFVVCALPIGGYVKMLDESEAAVAPQLQHLAFNRKPLRSRAAVVAAGPAANLVLAVLLYAAVNWSGLELARAVLPSPLPDSVAQKAGLQGGELVTAAGFVDDDLDEVQSFEDVRWWMTRAALQGRDLRLVLLTGESATREAVLALSAVSARDADAALMRRIGLPAPWTAPVIQEVMDGGAAQRAGLQAGDRVISIDARSVADGAELRARIRSQVRNGQTVPAEWRVDRHGEELTLVVTPDLRTEQRDGQPLQVGRIGAAVGSAPQLVEVNYDAFEGLWRGVQRTWEVSSLTVSMLGRMLVGDASVKNLSGPLTIADYAGKSASLGLTQYVLFLALISVSLGVLNLLPLPVLDGGHLMYYLWEAVTGKPIPDVWLERFQRLGVAVLLMMMGLALFNDVLRLLG
jgi:regulator of sigma E protease